MILWPWRYQYKLRPTVESILQAYVVESFQEKTRTILSQLYIEDIHEMILKNPTRKGIPTVFACLTKDDLQMTRFHAYSLKSILVYPRPPIPMRAIFVYQPSVREM